VLHIRKTGKLAATKTLSITPAASKSAHFCFLTNKTFLDEIKQVCKIQTFSQLKHLVISERFDVIRKTQYGNFLNIFDQHFLWQTASFYLTTVDDPETFIL